MQRLTVVGAAILFVCAGGAPAEAQGVASSFDQLSVLVTPGDKIRVVDVAGRETVGRVGTLSRDALILVTDAGPRQLGEADVATIRQRRDDPLKNGAVIGAVAGTAYGVLGVLVANLTENGELGVGRATTGVLFCTGLGAAIGVGIDALITHQRVVYQGPATRSKVSVSPFIGRGRRGVAVSVRF